MLTHTPQIVIKMNMLKFWNRFTRLVKRVFLLDYNIRRKNWCSEIKQLDEEIDQVDLFTQLEEFDFVLA